jgi:hypothetical protein
MLFERRLPLAGVPPTPKPIASGELVALTTDAGAPRL